MLDVNEFNALRIGLASPEQILSWSYGEVTKPETINYRTLKPERDGLFCERIFGPTKDYECYCGKYKRYRYKGIICDKCGVEVARSRVRRERMGHIELAAAVSHIWYFKGTPSRIGQLLDISPRNLERVLYFAAYIISKVEVETVQDTLANLEKEEEDRRTQLDARTQERIQEIEETLAADLQALDDAIATDDDQLEELIEQATVAEDHRVTEIRDHLADWVGGVAEFDLIVPWQEDPFLAEDDAVEKKHLTAFEKESDAYLNQIAERVQREQEELKAQLPESQTELREQADREISDAQTQMERELAALPEFMAQKSEDLQMLERLLILDETQYQRLSQTCEGLFQAAMGAEGLLHILRDLDVDALADHLREEVRSTTSSQKRKKAIKRMRIVESFRRSGNRPEWMILSALPVLPPDLRPMVQLDGGRFATSDLNDLYRRVINRNNRLKKLLDLGAPEIIIRNEKRMLQEAVDALVDNGRRGRAVAGSTGHKLKSLSDLLRGKQGRFRQNLLGKRVDYSGRSVIVVGPDLRLHQCGLPKRMALELFKPFVMRALVDNGHAATVKMAKRMVERGASEVWDALEEVTTNHPVLLNRAPTLHRLGIQAFEVVLVEGNAVQLHPLVCQAFNADFDGDQMAVHVPLSRQARAEAYELMLSSRNMLLPADGSPVVSPTKDMVLGSYYLTSVETPVNGAGNGSAEAHGEMAHTDNGKGRIFNDFDEVMLAHEMGMVGLREPIKIRANPTDVPDNAENPDNSFQYGELYDATPGRVIFNRILPRELRFRQEVMDKGNLKDVVDAALRRAGPDQAIKLVDDIKEIGFHYATLSGSTIAMSDIEMPGEKLEILADAEKRVSLIEQQYRRGIITEQEQNDLVIRTWKQAQDAVTEAVKTNLSDGGNIHMMSASGAAKGGFEQVRQLAGMRGLMADPHGNVIPLPVRSNLREGMSVLEYFISTHGARKGLADTALRTADSGYLTRRLIDVAQEVIIREDDCGAAIGITTRAPQDRDVADSLGERVNGRFALHPILNLQTGEIIVDAGALIDDEAALAIDEAGLESVQVRSPVTCQARVGLCAKCYGRDLGRNAEVAQGTAVGIIAAQSIGEPGTQLTMRTFHTGGVATEDITRGLPRVEELFEARLPKGVATISDIDGEVSIDRADDQLKITVTSVQSFIERIEVPEGFSLLVADGDHVEYGDAVARLLASADEGGNSDEKKAKTKAKAKKDSAELAEREVFAHVAGRVSLEEGVVSVHFEETEEREYSVPLSAYLLVKAGDSIRAGDQLTEGSRNPQDVLRILGREAVQRYLVDEVQKVYRSQGVYINDKHIEVIVRQMLRRVRIEHAGDTDYLPGELVDRLKFEEANERVLAEGGEAVTAEQMLLGITKSSLQTDSFLAAASFQETTRVLTDAALEGTVDRLVSLKENVIIGKLIPAGTGIRAREEAAALRKKLAAEQAAAALFADESEEQMAGDEPAATPVATLQEQAARFFEGGDGEEGDQPVVEGDQPVAEGDQSVAAADQPVEESAPQAAFEDASEEATPEDFQV